MGLLNFLFEEADKLKKEKDMAEGFAEGVKDAEYEKKHPFSAPIREGASEMEDAIRGESYKAARRAGKEYAKRYKK